MFSNGSNHAEYDFLSNFHEHPLQWMLADGTKLEFRTPEGCYQWLKCCAGGVASDNSTLRTFFQNATGQQAWDKVHVDTSFVLPHLELVTDECREGIMAAVLQCKFADAGMGAKLLATGDAYLAENGSHDKYWADGGDGGGANRLGVMLMELRGVLGGTAGVAVSDALKTLYAEAAKVTCPGAACGLPGHLSNSGVVFNKCSLHMDRTLTLGSASIQLPLSALPDGTGRFLYFNLNALPAFVEEGASLVDGVIEAGTHSAEPILVLPETSTIALGHVLTTTYGRHCILVSKSQKPGDGDRVSVSYCAATSTAVKTMYVDRNDMRARMEGGPRPIYFVDNVCTTGETLRALYKLMCECGVADCVVGAVVLFTEGVDMKQVEVAPGVTLALTAFAHIPIFPRDPAGDGPLYGLVSSCKLPTTFGLFTMHVFEHRTLRTEAVVLCSLLEDPSRSREDGVLLRVHDACLTSEVFGSCKCDCKLQLEQAQARIAAEGGLIIYLKQEGRGIGLAKKIQAYDLQESRGLDTVEANRELGLPDDMREYTAVRDILQALGIRSVRLLSNNPRKGECLQALGVQVDGWAPCVVKPTSQHMRAYMQAKKDRMGHMIPSM